MPYLNYVLKWTQLASESTTHFMLWSCSLPDSYEVVQQTLLATIDFPKATTATISNICSCILSEELRQGSTSGVSAIKCKPDANKGKCNYCGGTGHWEKDCKRKECGLSREEAKAERKGKWKKGKGTEKKDESAASVKAVITKVKESSPGSTSDVPTPSTSETACFYIACDQKWMLDSGCTDHITSDISDFTTYRTLPTPQKAWFADGKSYTTYIGIGTVKGTTKICREPWAIELSEVLHSPGIGGRFFSVLKAGKKGFETTFTGHSATITKGRVTFVEAKVHGNHYWATIAPSPAQIGSIAAKVPIETLHARLGHLSWSSLQRLTENIDPTQKCTLSTCEGCLLGKSTRCKFPATTHQQTKPFTLVHMDLAGPMKTHSIQGHYYHFVIVDDYTCYKWVYFLTGKNETYSCFKAFHALISTYYNGVLWATCSDCGGEFCSAEFSKFMTEKGIHHQLTAPHTPQQNGIAKRANRTIAEAARGMLQVSGNSLLAQWYMSATMHHPMSLGISPHMNGCSERLQTWRICAPSAV